MIDYLAMTIPTKAHLEPLTRYVQTNHLIRPIYVSNHCNKTCQPISLVHDPYVIYFDWNYFIDPYDRQNNLNQNLKQRSFKNHNLTINHMHSPLIDEVYIYIYNFSVYRNHI